MSENDSTPNPSLWPGVLLWASFAVIAVAVRGVRWDENYEFAQAMNPAFGYPETHPLFVYVRNAYNGQIYFSALAALIIDNAVLLNGMRNAAFVAATVLPPFLLGTVLARNTVAGHLCAVFVLYGIHLEFDGTYPQFVWPGMFSNGHIGTGFALAALALFAGNRIRTAAFMLGIMPLLHLGQAPPLFALALVCGAAAMARKQFDTLRPGVPYVVAGLLVCLVFLVIQRTFGIDPAQSGPYSGELTSDEAWSGIVQHHDMHRRIPVGNSHLVPLMLVVVAIAGWRYSPLPGVAWSRVCSYAAIVGLIVYTTIALQLGFGEQVPYVLVGWLPYRLANHLPIVLLALTVTVLLLEGNGATIPKWFLVGALMFLLVRPVLTGIMNESTFQRYFSGTESIYFVLVGAAWGQALQKIRGDRTELLVIGVSSLVLWMGIAWLHQFGAACLALGAVACAVMSVQVPPAIDDQRRYWVAAASLMMILGASLVWTEIANRSHLQTGAFENEVRNKLDADGQSSAMLVGPPYQLTLQAQTHHPVMSDMATHYHGSYMPSLAPSVHRMYHAVYGIDLTRPNGPQPGWQSVWAARSAREWAEVGQTYAFEYVVAPTPLNVDLELLIEGSPNSLYRIWPEATASSPPEPVGNGASDARREAQTTDPD